MKLVKLILLFPFWPIMLAKKIAYSEFGKAFKVNTNGSSVGIPSPVLAFVLSIVFYVVIIAGVRNALSQGELTTDRSATATQVQQTTDQSAVK